MSTALNVTIELLLVGVSVSSAVVSVVRARRLKRQRDEHRAIVDDVNAGRINEAAVKARAYMKRYGQA